MANLSQLKREKMLNFLEQLKEQHSDDASLIALTQIEKELTAKKYGLVWEEHEEEVDTLMNDHIPVFTEDKEKEIVGDPFNEKYNFLIEGDNLHSLTLLEKTHKDSINIIYIDPPYNTGSKDFIYGDEYIVKEDGYRHSKWLSFMSKRLQIAKKLLTDDGLIYISISDIEQPNLRLLCNQIFGEQNFVANLVWTNKEGGGSSDSKLYRIKHEYILVYAKNIELVEITGVAIGNEDRYKSSDEFEKVRGKYYLQKLGMGSIQYSKSLDYPIKTPDGTFVMPSDNNRGKKACWRWSQSKYEWGVSNGFVEIKKDPKGIWTVYTKQYLNCDNEGNIITRTNRPMGVIDEYSSTQGAKTIQQIFGNSAFSYPKDVNLISWILERNTKKDITVLDFFAGSGTTGHAILNLNSNDGGTRSFILCTDNENNICESVTYNRIKKVILGYESVEPKAANLKYYQTDLVLKDNENIYDDLLDHIVEMIQLQYGIKVDNKKYVIIMDDDEMDAFEKSFDEYKDLKVLFINQDVLLSTSQEKLLKDIDTYIIPDCYFDFELREAGELW